jgi:hypothetical protein
MTSRIFRFYTIIQEHSNEIELTNHTRAQISSKKKLPRNLKRAKPLTMCKRLVQAAVPVRWTWFLSPSRRSRFRWLMFMGMTGSERRAREAARLVVVVVLPTPPLPEVTTTHSVGLDGSETVRPLWWRMETTQSCWKAAATVEIRRRPRGTRMRTTNRDWEVAGAKW